MILSSLITDTIVLLTVSLTINCKQQKILYRRLCSLLCLINAVYVHASHGREPVEGDIEVGESYGGVYDFRRQEQCLASLRGTISECDPM